MYIKKLVVIALVCLFFASLVSEVLGDFYPGKITVCFSADMVGNTTGDFSIEKDNDIVVTPFDWLNTLATEYQIIDLRRKHWVKDQQWNDNGRYPMNIFEIEIKDHSRTDNLLAELSIPKDVLFAELVAVNRLCYTPNDPFIGQQWALTKIQAYQAWDMQTGSEDIIIGICDSGVKWNHADLAANMYINTAELPGITINWENGTIIGGDGIDNDGNGKIDDVLGWDFYANTGGGQSNNPFQNFNGQVHGTHVAGISAAVGDNGVGVAGVAYNCKIIATKHTPYNVNSTSVYNGYDGIYYLADAGAHIINCSWGGGGSAEEANTSVNYATAHGSLVVAAAGNNGSNLGSYAFYPACATNTVNVANTQQNDTKNYSSNYGTAIDVSAPGTDIYATFFNSSGNNTYNNLTGTSMASPVVAGVAGLIKSQNPALTPLEIKEILKDTADPIDHLNTSYTGMLGTGRVNAFEAIMAVERYINVTPLAYNFGNIETGTSSDPQTFILTNIFDQDITINEIAIVGNSAEYFLLDAGNIPTTIVPEGIITFDVAFHPLLPGSKKVFIHIMHNESDLPYIVTLSGTGIGNFPLPYLENFDSCSTLTEINWAGNINSNSGIFSSAGVGNSKALAMNLNSDAAFQNVVTPSLGTITVGSELTFAYRIVDYHSNWEGALVPTNIHTNNYVHIQVSQTGPSGLYYILGSINYTNHESSTDFVTVTLPLSAYAGREINIKFFAVQGSGNWFFVLDDVAVSGQPPAPEIVIDPLSFDFGSLDVGLDSPNAPFTITNIGNSPLHISSIEIEGPDLSEYDIILPDDLPWVIDHDTPKVFYVTFAPLSVGTKSASVVITHNASETPVAIPLAGEGLFVAEEDSVELPKTTHLGNNYPNPFNPETTISFSLVKESYILLDIYNIKGQKVYTLVDNELSAGHHNIVWYGIDQNGNAQSSGVYFYRMKTAEYQAVKKMILMK